MEQRYVVFTHRTTFEASTQLTEEEYRVAIAKANRMPLGDVPVFDSQRILTALKEHYQRVRKITAGFKTKLDSNPKTTKDKYEELEDIGRFIIAANDEPAGTGSFELQVPKSIGLFPDFVLTYVSKRIGVEHTRLVSEEIIQIQRAAKWVLKKAAAIITKDLGHLSKTVNIYFDYDQNVIGTGSFKKKNLTLHQKIEASNIIADFVRAGLNGGQVLAPGFIAQVDINDNKDSRVDIELGQSFFTESEFSKQLLHRIAEKERKAGNYRTEVGVDLLWLLIVIDDIASYSNFNMESANIPEINTSNFDTIMLFEKHAGKIHPIFPQNRVS